MDDEFAGREFPIPEQRAFAEDILKNVLGFDLDRGRLDTAAHPFCAGIASPFDVRLTTRFIKTSFASFLAAILALIHECGHGHFEQGMPSNFVATPIAAAPSCGMHESQSRILENYFGRSKGFLTKLFERLQKSFPAQLSGITFERFYRLANQVKRGFIRVEADRVTYPGHIMVRFNLERRLVEGTLKVADVPTAWNQGYLDMFGMVPPSAKSGCLQDIHWSMGGFGYFPSYTGGDIICAQLWEKAVQDKSTIVEQVDNGDCSGLVEWLHDKVHRFGRQYSTPSLVELITGKAITAEPYWRHLVGICREIYGTPLLEEFEAQLRA